MMYVYYLPSYAHASLKARYGNNPYLTSTILCRCVYMQNCYRITLFNLCRWLVVVSQGH